VTVGTKIEWTHGPRGELGYTFNGWIGCTEVSIEATGGGGCDNCYAREQDKYRHWTPEGWGAGRPRKRTSAKYWEQPLHWDAAAAAAGERRRVFCSSLADVFDNEVPEEWRAELFDLISRTPNLDWLLLTKRIGNANAMIKGAISRLRLGGWKQMPWPWHNVWIGVTVVNQAEAHRDIPKLQLVHARLRFLSLEPLLGPIDLTDIRFPARGGGLHSLNALDKRALGRSVVEWVIVGFESGADARPGHPDWARSLRDQCAANGVPFFFKQYGEWAAVESRPASQGALKGNLCHVVTPGKPDHYVAVGMFEPKAFTLRRIGKKVAGRLLDGVEHSASPELELPR
jgi:protein gp37